jgi:acyl carrier protein
MQMPRMCCERCDVCRMGGTQEAAVSNVMPDDVIPEQPSASPDPSLVTRVTALIRDSVGVDVPDPTRELLASGLIDSLSFVSLLLAMEQEFGISIDVDSIELSDFRSVERIARFIALELTRSNAVDLPVAS